VTLPIPTPEYRPVKLRAGAEEAGRV
jgi:hypothetical protein